MGVKRIVDDAYDPNNVSTDVHNESLVVDPGVTVPVVFIGGPNNNTFVDNGSNYAIGYGGSTANSSSDTNDLEVGPNVTNALLVGGAAFNNISDQSSATTYLIGGPSNNQITGGTGNDTISRPRIPHEWVRRRLVPAVLSIERLDIQPEQPRFRR